MLEKTVSHSGEVNSEGEKKEWLPPIPGGGRNHHRGQLTVTERHFIIGKGCDVNVGY